MNVKICCISSIDEAETAFKNGANYLGLVGPMPSGPGIISLELASIISKRFSDFVNTVFLCSKTSINDICFEYDIVKSTHIQLVDSVDIEVYKVLLSIYPDLLIIQVLHVIDQKSVFDALMLCKFVHFLLLDSGNPKNSTKILGGTGKVHDWGLSKEIVEKSSVPVFLAGGINSENVRHAIDSVKPFGVDLCSSVRTNGNLDSVKLLKFFEAIKT